MHDDGSGPALFVAGTFQAAGGMAANHVARWDGSAWSALGNGLNGRVRAFAATAGSLHAGGEFNTAGPTQSWRIARFGPAAPITYCTAKVNSCGSQPSIAGVGTPSASAGTGFDILATNARAKKFGLLLYSDTGAAVPALPFQGGFLCLKSPLKRTVPVQDASGTAGQCDGVLSIDMNAFAAGALGGNPLPTLRVPGTEIFCQFWGRDAPGFSLLSNALQYAICP